MAAVGRAREEKEKYDWAEREREREREKDLRRWRASPLINHTRLYYFPFKLPPFRWPREKREGIARWETRATAQRRKRRASPRSPSSRTTHLLLPFPPPQLGINMSVERTRTARETAGSPLLHFPLLASIHHSVSYHLDSFLFRLSFHLAILLYRYRQVQESQCCFFRIRRREDEMFVDRWRRRRRRVWRRRGRIYEVFV